MAVPDKARRKGEGTGNKMRRKLQQRRKGSRGYDWPVREHTHTHTNRVCCRVSPQEGHKPTASRATWQVKGQSRLHTRALVLTHKQHKAKPRK